MTESGFEVTRVDDLARIPVAHGLEWRPIARRFGIRAFGMNAYTSAQPGDWVVEEHTEQSGHEEVYVVLAGRATFTVGGGPDKAFEPSSWEWFFEAYQQEPEQGIATLEDGIRRLGERPELLYHLACMEAKAGRDEDALRHLIRAIELRPDLRKDAEGDDDLKEIVSDLPEA